MKVKDFLTINSVVDFRITLFQLFYGDDVNIFVEVDGEFNTINLNQINTFDDIFNLGNEVFLVPKIIYNWDNVCNDYDKYKNLYIHQSNKTFTKYINYKVRWVNPKSFNLRFMLEHIFPDKYLKHITHNSIIFNSDFNWGK